jgi:2-dehydro-3-deoxyphosphooctonate aldolase (KDO 8-P synthase)
MRTIKIKDIKIANNLPFTLIAGPCQVESLDHSLMMAESLKKICDKLKINLVYKSSFDKANRSSIGGKRGAGLEKTLPIFARVKKEFDLPILTDIHNEEHCRILGQVEEVDILQVPAFLCRQTDLLEAAAKSGKVINVKKGQFLAPWDAENIVKKMDHFGNKDLILTERGVSFGYNTLVSDMRSLPIMAKTGCPVVFDATHSVQQPGGLGGASGGQREFVETLACAATAVGVAGLFMETHQDPDNAPSDGPCMVRLDGLEKLLVKLKRLDEVAKS